MVEDEAGVRHLAARLLRALGYEVVEVDGAAAAIEVLDARARAIDLVLTDVVMPEMSGPDMVRLLRRTRPNIPVVYMSGYAEHVLGQHGDLNADAPLVPKPFDLAKLGRAIRHALASIAADDED